MTPTRAFCRTSGRFCEKITITTSSEETGGTVVSTQEAISVFSYNLVLKSW